MPAARRRSRPATPASAPLARARRRPVGGDGRGSRPRRRRSAGTPSGTSPGSGARRARCTSTSSSKRSGRRYCTKHSSTAWSMPSLAHLGVRPLQVAQVRDAGLFEVQEVVAVVHDAHRVGLGEADPDPVDERVPGRVERRVDVEAHRRTVPGTQRWWWLCRRGPAASVATLSTGDVPKPPSSSGLGHHPFKVAARVRIPLGVQQCNRPDHILVPW